MIAKKNCVKKFPKKILQNFFLLTLVEVHSSWLKLKDNEIFLLQWIEVSWNELKWWTFIYPQNKQILMGAASVVDKFGPVNGRSAPTYSSFPTKKSIKRAEKNQ